MTPGARIVVSIVLVSGNVVFLVCTMHLFAMAFRQDMKIKKLTLRSSNIGGLANTTQSGNTVVKVAPSDPPPKVEGKSGASSGHGRSKTRRSKTSAASQARIRASFQARIQARNSMSADKLHQSFIESELQLKRKHAKQQEAARRHTMQRVKARAALIKSKKLKKVEIFQDLSDAAIGTLVGHMKGKVFAPGDILVRQGDAAAEFFIISTGQCNVIVDGELVNTLSTHAHFGESAVTVAARMASSKDGDAAVIPGERRNASVVANLDAEGVQVLFLDLPTLTKLFEDGTLDAESIMSSIQSAHERRLSITANSLAQRMAASVPATNSRSLFS